MKSQPQPRRNARRYALQALYQWNYMQVDSENILQQFIEDHNMHDVDVAYFKHLVTGTIERVKKLDQILEPHLDREISALNPVELSILRLALFELTHCQDVPHKVVINEAIELTKEFGSEAGHKYVNGVLDALSKEYRS